MPTKKKQTPKPNAKKKAPKVAEKSNRLNTGFRSFVDYIKLHKVVSILIAVVMFGLLMYGGMIVYEKWQFNKAEKALDSIYADIVNELGEPTEVTKDKRCGYSSAKYTQGDRSCSISYLLKSNDEKATYANKLHLALNKSKHASKIDGSVYNYSPALNYSFSFKAGESALSCSVSVDQGKAGETYGVISCYGSAKKEYYPTKK